MPMRLKCLVLVTMFSTAAASSQAALLMAERASVMCTSATALAKLGLPGGGSRDSASPIPPSIASIVRSGNCTDFPAGHVVILERARLHTSIVRTDSLSGDGVMMEAYIANIDYGPYVPPHDVFDDAIRARCPGLMEGIAAEEPPASEFIGSLPPPLRSSIDKALDDTCGPDGYCLDRNRPVEIDRRQLQGRWALFLCSHPTIALEPTDRSAPPLRD